MRLSCRSSSEQQSEDQVLIFKQNKNCSRLSGRRSRHNASVFGAVCQFSAGFCELFSAIQFVSTVCGFHGIAQGFVEVVVSVSRAIATTTSVALVEELLFRSWLPEEIAADLGYHQGIIWSGLAYSLFLRCPWAIPGLWLLSFGLAGLRHRNGGSLSAPIVVHTGIMATSFILQAGGFLTYNPNIPLWMTRTHPFRPCSGVVGLAFAMVFAILLYPRNSLYNKAGTAEQAAE